MKTGGRTPCASLGGVKYSNLGLLLLVLCHLNLPINLSDNIRWRIHRNVAASVDAVLAAQTAGHLAQVQLETEIRSYDGAGKMVVDIPH